MRASLIGRLLIGFAVAVAIAMAAVGVAASTTGIAIDDPAGAVVLHGGWDGGGLSPIGLIIGVVVLILVVKVVFRLIAGPRWYGGPWAWGHGHPGWHGERRDPSEAFRRWHEQAHAQDGPSQGHDRPGPTAGGQDPAPAPREQAPSQPPAYPPYPAQPPQWPPYPAQPPQWPTYPGQPPQWPDQGQPPAGPRR